MIAGPQGSGKTTQAQILAQKLGLPLIIVGDMLRELAKEESKWGRMAKVIEHGALADDHLVVDLVKEKIDSPAYQKGFITDGYPRTLAQYQLYDPKFNKVFYLDVPEHEVIKRMLLRGREDDTPEKIEKRLAWYRTDTQPLLDLFRSRGTLVVINGGQPPEKVTEEILSYMPGQNE